MFPQLGHFIFNAIKAWHFFGSILVSVMQKNFSIELVELQPLQVSVVISGYEHDMDGDTTPYELGKMYSL